jgi:membrane associated rhomboid family serine protease
LNWIDQLERRFRKFAIPNLMHYIIGINALVFIMSLLTPPGRLLDFIILDPIRVLQGEVWRLVSFAFIPPSYSPIWLIFVLYLYYMIGTTLEQEWGSFKFNLFYLIGILATIIGAFLTGAVATSVYLYSSLFLIFAYLYPDFELLLFFILPVKMKYLAWLNLAFIGYSVIINPLPEKIAALAPLVGIALFYGKDIFRQAKLKHTVHQNRKRFLAELSDTPPRHKCTICGKTEKSHPRMLFRYCKSCAGDYEYCEEHLQNHEHIKAVH